MALRADFSDHKREGRLFTGRVIVAALFVGVLVLVLVARLSKLQVLDHRHYTTLSLENRVKLLPLPPTRGLIYDRNGVLLAENRPAYSLEITPEQVKDMDLTLARLGHILPITDQNLQRFRRQRKQLRRFDSIPLLTDLTQEHAAQFAVHRHRFPGVDIHARLIRNYTHATATAHVLGYVGRISKRDLDRIDNSNYAGTSHIGKLGVEKSWENTLHGKVGTQQVEVNAVGRIVRVLAKDPPDPGREVKLYLDVRLQELAMRALGDHTGSVVAIEPKTGGVLALASKPGYNPNLFVEGISGQEYRALQTDPERPLYNRSLRGQYPPGSTVKPFIGLAGLETGRTSPGHSTYCPGFYQLPGHSHKYRCWKKTGHGSLKLHDAIKRSCDVYFYSLAHDIGIDRLYGYLANFGFGAPTGIDLVGESSGLLPSRQWKRRARHRPWYPGETLIAGIGQGYFLTTPLQLAVATATFANGGTFIRPRLVHEVRLPNQGKGELVAPKSSPIPKFNPMHWSEIRRAMLAVTEEPGGTATRIRTDAYRIAGKTGTAQVFTVKQDEEYKDLDVAKKLKDHALFIAYAPADDPKIAVAVVVENGGHGGSTAAPIARKVMDAYLLGKYE